MVASLINALAILGGAFLGLLLKKIIKKEICDSVLKAIGIVVLLFGIAGVLKTMLQVNPETGAITTSYELILIVTLAVGMMIGELLKIDQHIEQLGDKIEAKMGKGSFSIGFVSATLVFCVGAMAIIGSVNAALGDPNTLYLKSAIDMVTSLVLASTLGFGVLFAAIPVLLYQGSLTIAAIYLGNFMSAEFVAVFSMVGYAMVACIGFNFLAKERIKIANMLPALILVVLYFVVFK
ncbi:MAG: DUF554 domain-containing protein [Bacilli bacterium]|jgi:hypothetical protein|nr:DUF554 domain-containing protein [Bacilli bacterium]MDD4056893.1 DUF554 domain-containing protein [Bacilli bacterium]MDY0209153.1 DUF554 domain-containing protein [Bacilli bacterium]